MAITLNHVKLTGPIIIAYEMSVTQFVLGICQMMIHQKHAGASQSDSDKLCLFKFFHFSDGEVARCTVSTDEEIPSHQLSMHHIPLFQLEMLLAPTDLVTWMGKWMGKQVNDRGKIFVEVWVYLQTCGAGCTGQTG